MTNSIKENFERFLNLPEIKQLEEYYKRPNLLKISGKHRSETAHSSFLAWLLNPNESHNLGLIPLKSFILLSFPEKDFVSNHTFNDLVIKTERSIKGGRLDILIDTDKKTNKNPFSVIIENKIEAGENKGQTEKYNLNQFKNIIPNFPIGE